MPVIAAWERLASATVGGRPLAVTRVLYAIGALWLLRTDHRRFATGFDPDRLHLDWPLVGGHLRGLPPALVEGAWVIGALLLLVGVVPRVGAAAVTLSAFAFYAVDRQHYGNGGYFIVLIGMLLVLADSGASATPWGPDRRRASWWPAFLLASQLTIVYLYAGVQKFRHSSLSGDTIAWQLHGPLVERIGWSHLPVALNLLGGIAEVFCAIGLWFALTRKLAVVVGVILHVGILCFLRWSPDMAAFAFASWSLYPAFWAASGPLADELARWRAARSPADPAPEPARRSATA
ncbi:MAG: HTTM domain-containing protein [Acidimicrobiales bacterium]